MPKIRVDASGEHYEEGDIAVQVSPNGKKFDVARYHHDRPILDRMVHIASFNTREEGINYAAQLLYGQVVTNSEPVFQLSDLGAFFKVIKSGNIGRVRCLYQEGRSASLQFKDPGNGFSYKRKDVVELNGRVYCNHVVTLSARLARRHDEQLSLVESTRSAIEVLYANRLDGAYLAQAFVSDVIVEYVGV